MSDSQFTEAITLYEKLVYTICYQLTRNHHTAQDLAQETFMAAYRHRGSCPAQALKPWLARIAVNKAKDYLKSAYNRRVQTPGEEGLPENDGPQGPAAPLPEDIVAGRETAQRLGADIQALKEPYRRVAELYFLQEQSVDEISKRLDRPPKTVHTQLYRAKHMLQDKLKGWL